jgi:signal transduction histidine kinase
MAAVLAVLALFELSVLMPQNSSFELVTGVSLYAVLLLTLALAAVANIVILLWRLLQMPPSYTRRQFFVLLLFTSIAIVPGQLLTFYPWLLFESPVLSWAMANLLLAFIPAGYAYVIYRRRYLQLDIFMTNTLTLLTVVVFLSAVYAVADRYLDGNQLLQDGILSPGLVIAPLLLAVPYASRPVRGMVESILYGRNHAYRERIANYSAALTADPDVANLRRVFADAVGLLQVRQAVLMLSSGDNQLRCSEWVRVEEVAPVAAAGVSLPEGAHPYLRDWYDLTIVHPTIAELSWVEAVVPLVARHHLVGLLLLGPPIPEGSFDAEDSRFLQQLADIMAVAALNVQLLEASRAMSRKLLQVRDRERLYMASRIHDEPLQRVSWLANELQRVPVKDEAELTARLQEHSEVLFSVATQLRSLCADLYPPVRQQGLQWAVRDAVYEFRRQGEWQIQLDIDLSSDVVVTQEVTASAYHILLEALNNIRKHAGASNVWVYLNETDGALSLLIEDDGSADEALLMNVSDLLRSQHFGLAGMYEWAGMVNGKLDISQRKGGGTSIHLTVPPPWQGM